MVANPLQQRRRWRRQSNGTTAPASKSADAANAVNAANDGKGMPASMIENAIATHATDAAIAANGRMSKCKKVDTRRRHARRSVTSAANHRILPRGVNANHTLATGSY